MDIRPAQPNLEAAAHYADLMEMAAQGLFKQWLGGAAASLAQKMYLMEGTQHSYDITYVAWVDDQIAGMISVCTGDYHRRSEAATSAIFMHSFSFWWHLIRHFIWFIRFSYAMRPLENIPLDAFYVNMIAVYPQFRGQGIGRALLAYGEERAQRQACRTYELDVDMRNVAAINLYKSIGMERQKSSYDVKYQGDKIHFDRMVKPLNREYTGKLKSMWS